MARPPRTLPYQCSELLQRIGGDRIRHGFFGREGGVSNGLYRSLNCAPASGDRPENIVANRRRCKMALGATRLYTPRQTHSARAVVLDIPPAPDAPLIEADALITNLPGLALGVLAADCMSVLFCDPDAGLIAAAHAGWRGTLSGILPACLKAMIDHGASAKTIRVAFGPSLRQPNFEVRADLRDAFLESTPDAAQFFDPISVSPRIGPAQDTGSRQALPEEAGDEKWLFDLIGLARSQLVSCGVMAWHIDILPFCTLATPQKYFSYRAACRRGENDFGRHLSAIVRIDNKAPEVSPK